MLYVERDQKGAIIGIHFNKGSDTMERKSIMDEEVLAFLGKNSGDDPWVNLLSMSDIGIIRIVEDLIDLLVRKNVIMFTDLPSEAQGKLRERKKMRERMYDQGIMVDDIL